MGDVASGGGRPVLPVSLAMTTLNEARSIGAFLRSVGDQTALPAEIVVCDGGSTDGTQDAIRAASVPGVSVVLVERPGSTIAGGRNGAIRAARQEIVAVSDAGCVLPPGWLERITRPMRDDPSVTVVGGGYGFLAETTFERIAAAAEIDVDDIDPEAFLPSSRSIAFRKSAWADAGGYPEWMTFAGEDTAFCLALRGAGHAIVPALDARVLWRPRPNVAAYARQHRLYGYGDGEARNKRAFYLRIALRRVALLAVFAAGFLQPAAFAAWGVLHAGQLFRLAPRYRWRLRRPFDAVAAYALIGVKEWSLLAGFAAGMSGGRRREAASPDGA